MKRLISVLFIAVLIASSSTKLTASSDIEGPMIIHKEVNQVFTIIDLLSLYDQDVFIEEDGYTGNGNVPGEYAVTLSQGLTNKVVTIFVVENWGDLENSNDVHFVTDLKNIHVSNNRNLILYEMIYYIYSTTGLVDIASGIRYEEIQDDYHSSFVDGVSPEGSYEFSFRLTYLSGEQVSYQTFVQTKAVQELPGIVIQPPESIMEQWLSRIPFILIGGGFVWLIVSQLKKKRGYRSW